MPPFILEVVLWTCVGAFVLCIVAGLLIVFGRWEPKDPKVKKWLLSGLLFSVVGSVGGFAGRQFALPSTPPAPVDHGNSLSADARSAPDIQPGPQPGPSPHGPAEHGPAVEPPPPVAADSGPPEEVRAWAGRALGTRPVLTTAAAANYPTCAARLRAQEISTVTEADAHACRAEVEAFHSSVLVSYYQVKGPYDIALQVQEARLRNHGGDPRADPRYLSVLEEKERLNGEDSAEENLRLSLDEQYSHDMRRCSRALCHS
jgi:hypothetical protein